jgi:SagB-type dehydrogenase family enzyme
MLLLTNTLSAKAQYGQELFYYRTAASAGALYPTEIYVGARGVSGLENGLYHFSIRRHALFPLHGQAPPGLTFFLTAVYFRSAWKYRDRAYRYHLLDTGHVAENLTLALRGIGLPFRLSYDFEDAEVNRLLGIDPEKEVTLALVQVPGNARGEAPPRWDLPEPHQVPAPGGVSPREVDYPMIREVHLAGGDRKTLPVEPPDMLPHLGPTPARWGKIAPPLHWPETLDYVEALFRRRSRRNFIKAAVGKEAALALLEALSVREAAEEAYDRSVSVGFLAGNVDGLQPGLHVLDREKGLTGWVDRVNPLEWMARICLDQMWLAHAGIHFLFLVDLDMLERSQGPRGYRHAMMSAGRLGQRLYLAATALGLGCCGIGAFYDREAAEFLGLRQSCRLLYLVAVGRVKRAK